MNEKKFYAHSTKTRDKSDWQMLEEHLYNVAKISQNFTETFGVEKCGWVAGLLHDLGKYSEVFQEYLERSQKGEIVRRGEVIHSLQGSKYLDKTVKDNVIADIIGNVIASHHGGLFDSITDGERTLTNKINNSEEELYFKEVVSEFSPDFKEEEIKNEIINFCRICQKRNLNPLFMLHLLTKAIYSSVVDADRCDSAGLEICGSIPDWSNLIRQLENHLSEFPRKSDIDKIRTSISEQCRQAGSKPQGCYTLSVPTGGGKTLSSLRFALEHVKTYKLKRIIYVIPYLSVLDQIAGKLHEVFSDDSCELILEHHSNMETPENDDEDEKNHLLISRWDSPIILTTMVQFLETIYSNKASKLRKFHNMAEAVLIFDEIQALPIKCIHLFNDSINFLQTFGKSTILLCTATQPLLHQTERPVLQSDKSDIIRLLPEELKIFERVCVEDKTKSAMDYEQIAMLVKEQIENGKSTLVILNTKKDASKVYEQCKTFECEKAFLTTDLCPAHRLNILARLRKDLDPKTKQITLCVSTQLIEAGIDVSFDCVIRAEAGIDSIIQAAGRCNRNKENPTPQTVFVINVQGENLSRLPEIKEGKSVTASVFREKKGTNPLNDEVINLFYKYYFYQQKDKMDYRVKDGKTTIYSLLNDNPLGTAAYRNRNNVPYNGLPSSFQEAAKEFSVIDGVKIGVVVPYSDAMQLVTEFQRCYDPKEKMRILKALQKYTVSIYANSLNEIKQAVTLVDDTFYLLSPDYYDTVEQGLQREAMLSLLYV